MLDFSQNLKSLHAYYIGHFQGSSQKVLPIIKGLNLSCQNNHSIILGHYCIVHLKSTIYNSYKLIVAYYHYGADFVYIFRTVVSTIEVILLIMVAKSKTRQTEVKPNWNFDHYRASSSMAGRARKPSQFFKIILPSAMQHMKLVMYPPLVI